MQRARGQDLDEVDIIIEAEAWRAALPEVERVVERAAGAALEAAPPTARATETAILLADDATLRDLNARYRGQDKATNVLSFPARDDDAPPPGGEAPPLRWGDVALAYETVAREAGEQGKTLAAHLSHLVVHGLLHLFGHDHEDEDEALGMEALEREILARIGIEDPYGAEQRG